ncbi:MAG: hypothetical protein DWQ08_03735 [Proteobacteria bacterium]|nr:MAG: hypothetical protein DWQ08_03735 [Pseudomonadota bacterium]
MTHKTTILGAGRRIAASVIMTLAMAAPAMGGNFSLGVEAGAGFKHNDDGGGLFVRALYLGENGGGCGLIAGSWYGDYENDVAGVTCEKRFRTADSEFHRLSVGIGLVDLTPSQIVNSDWALELHLRYFATPHIALAMTHFSNAGSADPNRGYNFLGIEVIF